jgi:hypothetical protein
MEVEGELSDQELAIQLGESSGTSESPRMPKLQPIDPRSAEEPTPGDMHVINENKSMLQRSPHTGEKPHSRRRRADYNSQPAETGNRGEIVINILLFMFTSFSYHAFRLSVLHLIFLWSMLNCMLLICYI